VQVSKWFILVRWGAIILHRSFHRIPSSSCTLCNRFGLTTPMPGPMHANRDSKEYPCQNISKLAARCTILVRWGAIILHRSFHADSRLSRHLMGSVRTCHTYIWSNAVAMDNRYQDTLFLSDGNTIRGIL
jgi:hypothetical protein